ncbi:unnamed protein product [Blepharisma stoltei]|uniref:TmcB/TmcC TPR repeats domain-containing protein n=1 Tax=Blepharisma stoltei TaxID=1481888 RepID=A0AAU9IB43_9CILI|nr:unnamed protein product [Blepharisma stoltei]
MQVEFSGEIRHSVNKNISAKAHSKIDKHIKFFTFIFPIVYVIFAEHYIRHLQILAIIFAILLIRETIDLLPYFSIFCNSLIILQLYFIGFISSIFLLGDLMDNSMVITMLSVIIGPLSAIFVIQFSLKLQRNFSWTIPTDFINIESQYILEKSLRYALCSNDAEHKDQIIRAFENFFIQKGLNGNKLQAIWAANYCLYTLKEESLAKIKLSKTKHIVDWSLESNYQEYLCQKNISNTSLSEGSQFSDYFLQSILVKNEEKQLCTNLLIFWSEITSRQPNLQKLRRKLYSIEDEILFLNTKYNQLITEFPNSKSLLSLYHSYCRDIIYNAEKSFFLEAKLRSIDKDLTNFLGDSKEFSLFNENIGILIISNEDSNFGEILYAEQKSAEYLKLPLGSIKNDNISNFIHPYYKEKFKEDSKRFIQYSSSSEIDLTKGFFLAKDAQDLLQLEGKMLLTSINGQLVAILVFKPKNVKNEIALLNEEGEIICHSNNFPKSVGKSEGLVGFELKNLFSNSEDFKLQLNTPYYLSNLNRFLMLSYSEFYKFKIPYVVLANDSREIIKRGNNENKQGNNEKIEEAANYLSVDLSGFIDSDKTYSLLNKENQNLDDDLNSKMELQNFPNDDPSKNADSGSDKRGSENSMVSVGTHQKKVLYLIKSSSRSINILHFAFVFSILTVVAFNIIVLNHAFSNINFISDMSLPINIGKAAKNLQRITYVSNLFVNLPYTPDSPYLKQMLNDIVTCLTELENTYSDITTNLKKWNYCSGQDILTGKNLYLWNKDDGIYKKSSLIDTIGIFIKIGNQILNKITRSEITTIDDFSFLILNGYGGALHYSNSSFYDIIDCQKAMMGDFKIEMTIFLSLGVAVLCICIIMIIPFYFSILKIENTLWNNIRKKAYQRYFELKQTIFERLRDVHSQPTIELNDRHQSDKAFSFKSYWNYIWRVLIYMAAVFIFSIVNISYLYDKCADYLLYRPEVLKNLINLQIVYTSLGIWTNAAAYEVLGWPMWYQFPYSYPFENSKEIFNEIISKIIYSNSAIHKKEYSPILSHTFKHIFYESNQGFFTDIFNLGVYTSKSNIINEANLISNNLAPQDVWWNLMSSLQELDSKYNSYIDEIDKHSKKVINDQMQIIVIALTVFIIFTLILYFGFYLVFFWGEKKYLKKINSVMEIMP